MEKNSVATRDGTQEEEKHEERVQGFSGWYCDDL